MLAIRIQYATKDDCCAECGEPLQNILTGNFEMCHPANLKQDDYELKCLEEN